MGDRLGDVILRALNKLSALAVKNAEAGKHFDGGGLFLRVDPNGSGRWVLRYSLHGRRREMGLGSRDNLSLSAARKEAERCREAVAGGRDPQFANARMRHVRLHLSDLLWRLSRKAVLKRVRLP